MNNTTAPFYSSDVNPRERSRTGQSIVFIGNQGYKVIVYNHGESAILSEQRAVAALRRCNKPNADTIQPACGYRKAITPSCTIFKRAQRITLCHVELGTVLEAGSGLGLVNIVRRANALLQGNALELGNSLGRLNILKGLIF